MIRSPMMSPLLSWCIKAAMLVCLGSVLVACSETAQPQPLLVSLRIFPANPVVPAGQSTPLTATGIFSDSSRQDLTGSVSWSSSAPRVVSVSDEPGSRGLMTAVATGTATIKAFHRDSGETAEAQATVPFPRPELSSVLPAKGPRTGGTPITLTGKWFETGITVTIGGAPVSDLRIVNETTVTAVTPPGAVGPQDVVVTAAPGSVTLAGGFTYRGAPVLTGVQPSSGPVQGGTVITLFGTDITSDTTVTLGGVPLRNILPVDETVMTAVTPPGTPGLKDLVITNALGSSTLPGGFSYRDGWRPVTTGMDGGYVKVLVRHPQDASVLYAGTIRGGVFKSTNAGQSWTPVSQGLTSLYIQGLVIDPVSPATLYAGTDRGLFKTTDGGTSWVSASSAVERDSFRALVLDPAIPTTMYATVANRGVLKTVDGGVTWTAVNTGLTLGIMRSLAMDPSNSRILYVGADNGAIYKTTNGGESWSPARTGVPSSARDIDVLVIDSSNPATLYAATVTGIYKSVDAGANWTDVNTGLTNRIVLSLLWVVGTPSTLYAGTRSGIFQSTTGGASWSSASTGLRSLYVTSLLAAPGNPSIVYAGTQDGGVFKSVDGAVSWAESRRGMNNTELTAITFSPLAPNVAYAGTRDGIFKTANAGESWSDVSQGLPGRQVQAIALHPTDSATVYVGTSLGLYKTVDGGGSWVSIFPPAHSVTAVALHPTTPETIYVGTVYFLYKSVDGGNSWTQYTQGFPSTMWVWSIVFSSQNPSTVFMTATDKVYRSTDDGAQWAEINTGLPVDFAKKQLAVAPGTTETLYMASTNQGLFKTVNGGASWERIFSSNAHSLAIDPQDPRTLYVGPLTGTQPLQVSRDGGRTWAPASQPFLTSVDVLALKPGDPQTILAGTRGLGVYKTTTGGE